GCGPWWHGALAMLGPAPDSMTTGSRHPPADPKSDSTDNALTVRPPPSPDFPVIPRPTPTLSFADIDQIDGNWLDDRPSTRRLAAAHGPAPPTREIVELVPPDVERAPALSLKGLGSPWEAPNLLSSSPLRGPLEAPPATKPPPPATDFYPTAWPTIESADL